MPHTRRRLRTRETALRAGFDAIRTELAVPVAFSAAATAEAEEAARAGASPGGGGTAPGTAREDLTEVPFVTLDPPGSTDLDQAMHLSRTEDGYRVRYAIADVAAFVVPGGALDAATHERVETVYCPDVRVPLHPPALSEGAASLLPDQVRPAVVWTIDLGNDGRQTSVDVRRATVRSRAQLDYPTVQQQVDAGTADPMAGLLVEIGTLRQQLERERGGVSLGRPEQEVVDLPDGGWGLRMRAPLPVEDHNAQLSLLTGMAAAGLMLEAGIGVLRTMPAAAEEDVVRLRRQARAVGVDWAADEDYGDVLARMDHTRPEDAAFLTAATVLFRGAQWTPFDGRPPAGLEHGALAAPYAHVTAPLRRLVDRYGLEVCLARCAGEPVPEWVRRALPTLGEEMAQGARRSASVDRACTDLVEAAVLAPHVGEVFEGVALDDRTVQLHDPAVVARTEGADLPEGEPVRVRLVAADPATRSVTFHLAT